VSRRLLDPTLALDAALRLAGRGVAVFPLAGKVPAIRGGRGVLDASTDLTVVRRWWANGYPGANIGARVPADLVVLDVDPRNGGLAGMRELLGERRRLPETLTVWSGRDDGGRHLYFRRPPGRLTQRGLPAGVDLKQSTGYCVVPPSLHPDTGKPYRWENHPPAELPAWLVPVLVEVPTQATARPARRWSAPRSGSVVDAFNATTSWRHVLEPHDWRVVRGDGDADRSAWRHPSATAPVSATITGGRLYVYTPNTPFTPTEPGAPRGYSRFEAWALLEHAGDQAAAARSLRSTGATA